jgi:Enoyl-CoA hydratase/carnithine racemase
MGGGLGLFMAAPFRLVTPYSRLAMPEINIGLYPDVGATRFLADRGAIGLFTGLTGSIMTAAVLTVLAGRLISVMHSVIQF